MIFVKTNEKNEIVHIRYNFTYDLEDVNVDEGMVFDELPIDEEIPEKYSRLMYDSENNELYYRYEDRIEPIDPITERINELESALVELASLLGGGK